MYHLVGPLCKLTITSKGLGELNGSKEQEVHTAMQVREVL